MGAGRRFAMRRLSGTRISIGSRGIPWNFRAVPAAGTPLDFQNSCAPPLIAFKLHPMKKAERISAFVEQLAGSRAGEIDPCYAAYFQCFNEQRYYEAHDVLEHLWLKGRDENYAFYKGLIQLAGAYVHLQKQFLRPDHPKDGRRLRPAARLFDLANANLQSYRPRHLSLDLEMVCALCDKVAAAIVASGARVNPWRPSDAPQLHLS